MVRVYRDLLDGGAVEYLRLHEDDGVVAADRGEQETFCLDGGSRDDDAEAGGVGEEGFGGLCVVSTLVSI